MMFACSKLPRPLVIVAIPLLALFSLLVVDDAIYAKSLDTEPPTSTCQSYQSLGYSFQQALVVGDSIMSGTMIEAEIQQHLADEGITLSPVGLSYTIPGQGNDDLRYKLLNGLLDSDIASSDLFISNLGVNDRRNPNVTSMAQVEGWIDDVIAYIYSVNPSIVIVWMEPHAIASLVPNPNLAIGALSVAAYLNTKDAAGEICLVDWSAYADANPHVYEDLITNYGNPRSPDGIHIQGNGDEYIDLMFSMIQSVEQAPVGTPQLIAPTGTDSNISPTFEWTSVASATEYTLVITDSLTSAQIYSQTLSVAAVNCANAVGNCTSQPAVQLQTGQYEWTVQAISATSCGSWSPLLAFTVTLCSPQMVAPNNTNTNGSPTFEWTPTTGAAEYELVIYNVDTDTIELRDTFSAAAALCNSGTSNCTIQPSGLTLSPASYTWLARSISGAGSHSPWSIWGSAPACSP